MKSTCWFCGDTKEGLSVIGFRPVCRSCLKACCQSEAVLQDYGEGFLKRQGPDFYLRWWWESDAYLTEPEKLNIAKAAYENRAQQFPEDAKQAMREYILETFPEWEGYLKNEY